MKDKIFDNLQKFSRSLVGPVLFLPIVGLLFAIFSIFTNVNVVRYLPFLKHDIIQIPSLVASKSLISIFSNLTPIFAMGIAFGLAKKDKANATLVSFMSLFVYLTAQNTFLNLTGRLAKENIKEAGQAMVLGIQVIDMGIFIAMIIGVLVSYMWNRYINVEFGEVFSIYAGSKFVFLITIPLMIALAIVTSYVWPPIQIVISQVTSFIIQASPLSMFTYGFLDRLLIPTGLHHLIYNPINYTNVGGSMEIGGQMVSGAYNIGMSLINDPSVTKLPVSTAFTGFGITKMFGLIGAGYAMIKCAKPENLTKAKAVLIPSMLASFLVGVTEPLEFSFLFISPKLFFVYSFLSGIFLMLVRLLSITSIMNRGFLEFALVNIPAGIEKTNWPMFIVLGLIQAVVYYFVFKWFIKKFKLKTVGREDEEEAKIHINENLSEIQSKNDDSNTLGDVILRAIGGKENILSINNCFTRLRLELKDINIVDESMIKTTNSKGIIKKGSNLQIIYGTNVAKFRNSLEAAANMVNSD